MAATNQVCCSKRWKKWEKKKSRDRKKSEAENMTMHWPGAFDWISSVHRFSKRESVIMVHELRIKDVDTWIIDFEYYCTFCLVAVVAVVRYWLSWKHINNRLATIFRISRTKLFFLVLIQVAFLLSLEFFWMSRRGIRNRNENEIAEKINNTKTHKDDFE